MAIVETKTLTVTGMHCGGCEQRVTRGLQQLPGVTVLRVSHQANEVQIRVNTAQTSHDQIRERIEAAGFNVTGS